MSAISRPLASMRWMISPTSLRRTPSPLMSTSVCSIDFSLSDDGLAAALVGAAVRAHPPLHVEWSVAVYARFLELPGTRRADQVVLLDHIAAVGAEVDTVSELTLQNGQLQLAFAGLFEVLVRTDDEVDQGAEVGEDKGDEAPEPAHGPAPGGVRVGPVDEGYPQHDEDKEHELTGDPQDGALQEIGDDLKRVRVLLECEGDAHAINLIIT